MGSSAPSASWARKGDRKACDRKGDRKVCDRKTDEINLRKEHREDVRMNIAMLSVNLLVTRNLDTDTSELVRVICPSGRVVKLRIGSFPF